MEVEVSTQPRMDDCPMFLLTIISRVDSLHTHIKSDDEVIEIQAQAQTIRYGYLLIARQEIFRATDASHEAAATDA